MDRCTGCRDITEILLKTVLTTPYNLSINHLCLYQSVLDCYSWFQTIPIFPLTEENLKKAKSFGQFQHVLAEVDEHYANMH